MNKKYLLTAINAKYIHSNLAVYTLQSYAKKYGIDVDIAEFTINQQLEDILRDIALRKIDVLFISCYIWNIEYVKELVNEFAKIRPDVPVWLGGPEVSFGTKEFLNKNKNVTGIIVGEGEHTFYELCNFYETHIHTKNIDYSKLNQLDGLAWRSQDNRITYIPKTKFISMDEIPFCYGELDNFKNRIIYYESSRGCPFSCSYCLSSIDKSVRLRSLNLVLEELQFFIDNRVSQVKFVDRTFNCNHEHAMSIWKYIFEHDNGVTNFHFEVSADLLRDDELLILSKMRPGLVQLEIGVQSTNEKTVKEIRRTMNIDKLKRAVAAVKKGKNIHQHLDLIVGLPDEDYMSFKKSFDDVYGMKPEQLQLGFLKVLKGSYMHEIAKAYELLYRDKPPYEVLATRWLSYEELQNIKLVEEMLEIHYNSGQFLRTLYVLEKKFDSAFDMFLELARFYQNNGYVNMSYTRIKRLEILYDFASFVDGDNEPLYRETLLFDLYIREKSKSRPGWALDSVATGKVVSDAIRSVSKEKRYCHGEYFYYNVKDIDLFANENILIIRNPYPLLHVFDYENRSWTQEATVTVFGNGGHDEDNNRKQTV